MWATLAARLEMSVSVAITNCNGNALPPVLLHKEEVGLVHAKARLVTSLAQEAVAERLEGGQEERGRGGKVGHCQTDVRDWHIFARG